MMERSVGSPWPWFISGRAHAVGVANTEYVAKKVKEGLVFLGRHPLPPDLAFSSWRPKSM